MCHKQKRGAQTRSCAPEENENFSVAELTRPLCQHAHSGPLLCRSWFKAVDKINQPWLMCIPRFQQRLLDQTVNLVEERWTLGAECITKWSNWLRSQESEIKTIESYTIKWLVSPHSNNIISKTTPDLTDHLRLLGLATNYNSVIVQKYQAVWFRLKGNEC